MQRRAQAVDLDVCHDRTDAPQQRPPCARLAPPHHAPTELGRGEPCGARSHEQREQRIAITGTVHDRRGREQQHLRAYAGGRGVCIAPRGGGTQMVRLVDDHELRCRARDSSTQGFVAHEQDRYLCALGRREPLGAEVGRREDEDAGGVTRRVTRRGERKHRLSRAGRIGEQRTAELRDGRADLAQRAMLCRPQREAANVASTRVRHLGAATGFEHHERDERTHLARGHPAFHASSAVTICRSIPYASQATCTSRSSLGGRPAAPSCPSGASSARARGQSVGTGKRAPVQPR